MDRPRQFIDCFNPDNRYSVTERASKLNCPALFVFGSEECGDGPQRLRSAELRCEVSGEPTTLT